MSQEQAIPIPNLSQLKFGSEMILHKHLSIDKVSDKAVSNDDYESQSRNDSGKVVQQEE